MMDDWRAWVHGLQPQARLFAPAAEPELHLAEQAIGGPLPADLRSLLTQTNGVLDEWQYGPILPLPRLVEATQFWRAVDLAAEYDNPDLSLATFVVIGTDAGGGPFGFDLAPDASLCIRYLDGEAGQFDETTYGLTEYLRYYFESLSSFST